MRVEDVQSSANTIAGSGSSFQKGLQQALTNAYFLQAPLPFRLRCRRSAADSPLPLCAPTRHSPRLA